MANHKSFDHSYMREMNLALVLNTLRTKAPLSRAELARVTGLRKATISSLVNDLLDGGFIQDIGFDTKNNQIGRPSKNLKLNPDAGYIIGAEIGVDFISVIATNFGADILTREHIQTIDLSSKEEILQKAIDTLHRVYDEVAKNNRPIFGIGIGVPGLIDKSDGTLLFAPNLFWHDVPLRKIFEKEFNIPVYVDNEANLAALGETYFGAGQDSDFVLYVVAGIGLGGGIVLDGKLLTGATGFAGEFGHMTVEPGGLKCSCGNYGCWETVASQKALFRRIREAVTTGKHTILLEMTEGNLNHLTVPLIIKAGCEKKDVVAKQALDETAQWLGIGIANLMNAFNPEKIVFGGVLSLAHECMMPIIQNVVKERALKWNVEKAEVVCAKNGADACVIGGIATVYSNILNRPAGWL